MMKIALRYYKTFKNGWGMFKERKMGVVGLGLIIMFGLAGGLAPILTPYDPMFGVAPLPTQPVQVYSDGKLTSIDTGAPELLKSIDWKKDGTEALLACEYGVVLAYDGKDFNRLEVKTEVKTDNKTEEVRTYKDLYAVSWKPDGSYALVGGGAGLLFKYQNNALEMLSSPVSADLTAIAWEPNGKYALIAGGTISPKTRVLLRYDGEKFSTLFFQHNYAFFDVAWKSDGTEALICGDHGTLLRYDGSELEEIATNTEYRLSAVSWAKDGKEALIVGYDIEHWEGGVFRYLASEKKVEVFLTEHKVCFVDVAWDPKDSYALIAGFGNSLARYDRGKKNLSIVKKPAFEPPKWKPSGIISWKPGDTEAWIVGYRENPFPSPPDSKHILGTDWMGRDIFSQLLEGAKVAFILGISCALITTAIGLLIGLSSGYYKGFTDTVLMRFTDIVLTLPFLPLAIVFMAFCGRSIWIMILVIALIGWTMTARVIRSETLSLRERAYVDAARVAGASNFRIIVKHILPNVLPLAFLYMTFAVSTVIIVEAALSFLGFGDPTVMSWGIILNFCYFQGYALTAWWWMLPPGLCITLFCLAFYLVGRSCEMIFNPRLRVRRWA